MSLKLYCVRHGETDWNVEKRIQGNCDIKLNAEGIKQAHLLGKYLQQENFNFTAIISSDLLRAQSTAEIIADYIFNNAKKVITSSTWRERSYGELEGLKYSQLAENFPLDFKLIENRQADYSAKNGESLQQLESRIRSGINQICQNYQNQSILLVTHGGVLDIFNRIARKIALETPRDFVINNCGLSLLVYQDRQWSIKFWSDISYLQNISQDEL